jgi:CheY-like chemotaxis protein
MQFVPRLADVSLENGEQFPKSNVCTILLVDDNAIQAATRQAILRRAGYFAIAVLSPIRALEQFETKDFPSEISLVITDHIMPGMTGSQFVRELRKTHRDLPIVVISGLDEAESEYDGMNVRFLLKPLAPDLLLSNIHGMLAQEQEGAA